METLGEQNDKKYIRKHARGTIAFKYRNALKLLTMTNAKTPKGEKAGGYLTATLYLLPHTEGGGPTVCPHSTEACRTMCLSGAGMSGLPTQMEAKRKRKALLQTDPEAFFRLIDWDIGRLQRIAEKEKLTPVVRLNGTSDILWERHLDLKRYDLQFYDYTKVPLAHRLEPRNYHLTYSVERDTVADAVAYLRAGHSVAAVVPEHVKGMIVTPSGAPWRHVVDGDAHDLRFLDQPGSLVLLRPKGNVITDLVIPDIDHRLLDAARQAA